MAEWLRSGLQSRGPRFDSGRGLQQSEKKSIKSSWRLAQALIYPPHQYGNISPVAQLVEQTAVNRSVAGSSPAWGAIWHLIYQAVYQTIYEIIYAQGVGA